MTNIHQQMTLKKNLSHFRLKIKLFFVLCKFEDVKSHRKTTWEIIERTNNSLNFLFLSIFLLFKKAAVLTPKNYIFSHLKKFRV